MTRPQIELDFAGERRGFALWIGELRRIKELHGLGPMKLYRRFENGDWSADETADVIRLGLEGAGTAPAEAKSLVERYLVERSAWLEGAGLAYAIAAAALTGPEDIPSGKAPAAGRTTSPSPPPTAPAP